MIVLTTLLAAIALQGAQQEFTDYKVENVRPSKIVAKASELKADDCTLVALDKESKIRVTGSEEQRKEMLNWLKLFDVKPLTVNLKVQVISDIDKTRYTLDLAVPNNETFSFTETATGCKVSLQPRINGDGTVTLFEGFTVDGTGYQVVARCKQGEWVTVSNPGNGTQYTVTGKPGDPHLSVPVLLVSPTVRTVNEKAK